MADVTFANAECAEKRDSSHDGDDPLHFDSDRNWEKIGAAVGKKLGARNHDAEDRARRTDGRVERIGPSPQMRQGVHEHVDQTGPGTGQKIVAKETIAAPYEFDLTAEHPEKEHVEDDVRNMCDVVQEQVSEWLPD